ncbi:hypothetical protein [Streptomyces cyaneus]|uniref:hypothetical protein n=1 Tax=Streptomyces cyaneus TaxID=1904 RepID=UPI0013E3C847
MEVLEAREPVDMDHPVGRSKRFLRLRHPDGALVRGGPVPIADAEYGVLDAVERARLTPFEP